MTKDTKYATKIFQKNLTSELLVSALLKVNMSPDTRCLDLGCGDGNIVLEVAKQKNLKKVYGSDVSDIAVTQAIKNAADENIKNDFRCGDSFAPWEGLKFDVIGCDIAAISQTIAEKSHWYDGVDCETGEDGLRLVEPIIGQVKHYLADNGIFVIPTISLANESLLLSLLEKNFKLVQMAQKKEWPMPEELIQQLNSAQLPMSCENWNVSQKFGLFIARTSAYICSEVK
jgi:SAM-dependent methyltransferase